MVGEEPGENEPIAKKENNATKNSTVLDRGLRWESFAPGSTLAALTASPRTRLPPGVKGLRAAIWIKNRAPPPTYLFGDLIYTPPSVQPVS